MVPKDERQITRAYQFSKATAVSFGEWWESRKRSEADSAEPEPQPVAESPIRAAAA